MKIGISACSNGHLPEWQDQITELEQVLDNMNIETALSPHIIKSALSLKKGKRESKTHSTAQAAKQYIEENYGNNELSISDISEKLCVNQTYLRKMFKSEMDMTLTEYITQLRMQEAKRLITSTDYKLTEVAERVGYNDVSYFSNVFKKFHGISPRSMGKE